MQTKTIGIVGLNRIGVSIGLALQMSSLDVQIIGHDPERIFMREAKEMGAVHETVNSVVTTASRADILILSIPSYQLEEILRVIGDELKEHTLVLDMSLNKTEGAQWAKAYFHQGHYVSGRLVLASDWMVDGRSDLRTATHDLFQDSILCLIPSLDVDEKAVETATKIGLLLGAKPYFITEQEFDALVQGSHMLPALLAGALLGTVTESKGWRDLLRFAEQPFALATQPIHMADFDSLTPENMPAMGVWLDRLLVQLTQLRDLVHEGDQNTLYQLLSTWRTIQTDWLTERKKNDWLELSTQKIEKTNVAEMMFGGLLAGRDNKDDE